MANYVPNRNATYVERLERAGAIVLGKTNTPEFGHRAITDNLLFGPTSTPFAPGKNAGGSSAGSAAAVADGLAPMAQGRTAEARYGSPPPFAASTDSRRRTGGARSRAPRRPYSRPHPL